jgi:integrase
MIRTLMLTALRRGEVADASRAEFDLERRLWTIPAERMKGEDDDSGPHVVPLNSDMLEIFGALPCFAGGDFVFTTVDGKRPVSGFSSMKSRLDKLMLEELQKIDPAKVKLEPYTIHDIRRSVRTHLSALPVPELVRELILAHAKPGLHKTYDQYAYLDEKREALELWAARLKLIVDPPASNVIALRA